MKKSFLSLLLATGAITTFVAFHVFVKSLIYKPS